MTGISQPCLWDWANECYRDQSVRETLLELQDAFGLNVNVMLWTLWRGAHFGDISDSEMRSAVEASSVWSEAVTKHIRAARRAASPRSIAGSLPVEARHRQDLYEALKSAELSAERIELNALEELTAKRLSGCAGQAADLAADGAADRAAGPAAARRALASYVRLTDAPTHPDFSTAPLARLVDALITRHMLGSMQQDSPDAAA